jgi:hypothetical protein
MLHSFTNRAIIHRILWSIPLPISSG